MERLIELWINNRSYSPRGERAPDELNNIEKVKYKC
jgi:hypothetical protein